jgi:branched-chain amino acid transport system substrate-binding protein
MKLLKLLFPVCIIFTYTGFLACDAKEIKIHQEPGKTVNIGLLVQDNKSTAARHGAEMAVRKANEEGGFNGIPFKLVDLSMEGPWGTGSKQAVNLIFDENVVAILGSCDGRNAHLVEQVSAKAHVIFISAWSGDPTLAQAFVPWYFSCVPNDGQLADALTTEICIKEKINKIAVVSDNDFESKLALNSFLKKSKISGSPDPKQFLYDDTNQDFNGLTDHLIKADINGIIFFGNPASSLMIVKQIQQRKINIPVFGSLSVMGEREFEESEWKTFENAVLITSGQWFNSNGLNFSTEFQKTWGYKPGPVAAYAYDGMNLIINAVKYAGASREQIQKYLKKVKYYGVTGTIQFDDRGNRIGEVELMRIKNGIPVKVTGN